MENISAKSASVKGKGRKSKKSIWQYLKTYWPFYVMMLPGIIYLFCNNYIPMAGLVMAFKRINWAKGIWASPWNGLKNFKYLFKTNDAWIITRNTIGYNLVFIVLTMVISVAVAILLNEVRNKKLRKTYHTLILVPYLVSMIIVSYVTFGFLSTSNGMINNSILAPLGKAAVSWYTEPKYWPFILTIVYLWKNLGYNVIIYYSSIISIDQGLYEAAAIDGASRWDRIRYVTLPSLKVSIITLFLLNIGKIFYSDFGLFYHVPLNSGILLDVTNTIDTYVYRGLLSINDIGRSTAACFYQSIVGFVVVMLANGIVRKVEKDSALF